VIADRLPRWRGTFLHWCVATASTLLWAASAAAQSYLIHTYTSDDGLPSSTVFGLAQEPSGRIWAATRSGIAAYDGESWEIQPAEVGGVHFVTTDEHGILWVATHMGEHLAYALDGGRWTGIGRPQDQGAPQFNLTAFEVMTGAGGPTVTLGTAAHGLIVWAGGKWSRLATEHGLPSLNVRGLARLADTLYVATDGGLCTVSGDVVDTSLNQLLPQDRRNILALSVSTDEPRSGDREAAAPTIWLVTTNGVSALSGSTHTTIDATARIPYRPWSISSDGLGSLYLGDRHYFYRLDLESGAVEPMDRANGLVANGVFTLLVDHERNVWVGGGRGLSKIVSRRFATYRRAHGLLEDEVTAVVEPEPGRLVFGHPSGISVLSDGSFQTFSFPEVEPRTQGFRRVQDLDTDAHGVTWIAAADVGLGRLDPAGELRWFGPEHGLALPVRAVLAMPDGTLRVATTRAMYHFDGHRFDLLPWHLKNLEALKVRRLAGGRDGTILMATVYHGLVTAHGGGLEFGSLPELPGASNAFTVLEDRQGRTWLGTQAGLLQSVDGRIVRPQPPALRIASPVYLLVEDDHGDLWVGTDEGVHRWDGSSTRHYTSREGLAGRETNRAAGYVDSQGTVWIGTDGGVSAFRRRLDRRPTTPPRLELISMEAGGEPLPMSDPIELSHHRNTLVFTYRAISFLDELGVRYRFSLDGSEDGWSEEVPSHHRSVRYTHLPPGDYCFHVQAASAAGVWSETVSSPRITILRPLWARPWFAGGALVCSAALLYLLLASVVRRRTSSRLEAEVEQRTAALRESEARYRRLFADVSTPKLLLDADGAVVDANRSALELCQRTRDELVGGRAQDLGLPWLDEALKACSGSDGGRSGSFTMSHATTSGVVRDVDVWLHPVRVQGRAMVLITAQDTTGRRQLLEERLRASKLESVGLLAGGIAHDFNNILAAALGNVALGRLRAERHQDHIDLLEAAEASLLSARDLTGQLLALSKGGEPVRNVVRLDTLLRESATLVLAGSRCTCDFQLAPDVWPAEVDEGQICQVIHNLVINADQAMPSGGKITLRAENLVLDGETGQTSASGPYVKVVIADHGVGIPADDIPRVFDPYFTTKEQGTGLGLATVNAVLSKHGGSISVASTQGVGTEFAILLPAAPDGRVRDASPPETEPHPGRGRILVLEDEDFLQELYRKLLEELGYESEVVADGHTLVSRYADARSQGRPFAATLLDLTVRGGMGAKDTLHELRSLDPDVRAVVASGYVNDPVFTDFSSLGFAGALQKPFTINQLAEVLERVLGE